MYQPVFGQKTTIEYSLLCLKGNSIYTKFAEVPCISLQSPLSTTVLTSIFPTTAPSDFSSVRESLEGLGLNFLEASVQMVPSTTVKLDEHGAEKMNKLIDNLNDLDDVMNVYHNWEE